MKNEILNFMKGFRNLADEEIAILNESNILNSEFKINLQKDKTKANITSDKKFYLQKGDLIIKFQFDEQTQRLAIYPSCDFRKSDEYIISNIDNLPVQKIDYYCNSTFKNLAIMLDNASYQTEVTRKEKFFNKKYIDEVVISKYKEIN